MKNITKQILVALTVLGPGLTLGQSFTPTWSSYQLTGSGSAVTPVAMVEDSAGFIYVLGTTPNGNGNLTVMKFSSAGSLVASAEYGSNIDAEQAYDIAIDSFGRIFLLGLTQSNKLYVQRINSSLASVWVASPITTTVPGGGTSPDAIPYRLAVSSSFTSSAGVFATAKVQETTTGSADLSLSNTANAVFYSKINIATGAVQYSQAWDGVSGQPDNLFGTHAVSTGMVFVTDTKQNVGGSILPRASYQKVNDSTGALSWSVTPSITTIVNRHHYIDQTFKDGNKIYTNFGNLDPISGGADSLTYEVQVGLDGSVTSTPAGTDFSVSPFRFWGTTITNQKNHGGGIGLWWGEVVSVGWGAYATLDDFHASWLRNASGTKIDEYATMSIPDYIFQPNSPEAPTYSQRCYDAYGQNLSVLARKISTNQFHFLASKKNVTPLSQYGTTTLTSGYEGGLVQVLASKLGYTGYVLLAVQDVNSISRVALYRFDRP